MMLPSGRDTAMASLPLRPPSQAPFAASVAIIPESRQAPISSRSVLTFRQMRVDSERMSSIDESTPASYNA